MEYRQAQVLLGMTDLGRMLDILATLRTTKHLLTDLIDHPEEIGRFIWEAHESDFGVAVVSGN